MDFNSIASISKTAKNDSAGASESAEELLQDSYMGSNSLPVEWTQQHGGGAGSNVNVNTVVQHVNNSLAKKSDPKSDKPSA